MFEQKGPVLRLLEAALGTKASVSEIALPSPSAPGAAVELKTRGGQQTRFHVMSWEERRDVPEKGSATWDGRYYRPLWVLKNGSRAAREELREAHACFVDLAGAVHLDLPYLIVDRSDLTLPNAERVGPRLIDPFADRSSRVVRRLLTSAAGRVWGVRELAAAAEVTPSTASRCVQQLGNYGLVTVTRPGRTARVRVPNPLALFRRWVTVYGWEQNARYAFEAPLGSYGRWLDGLGEVFAGESRQWALTLEAGAALTVGIATSWTRVFAYVDMDEPQELLDFAARRRWRPSETGSLVLVLPWYRESVWDGLQHARGLPVVSTLQLGLDLWSSSPAGRDHAERLVDMKLKTAWSS